MQVVTPQFIQGKTVLLRLDIDVPIESGVVVDDFRLQAAIPTLNLCLEHAQTTIVMGHIGRPGGKEVPELSVKPIYNWLADGLDCDWEDCNLKLLENLRFEIGEESLDPNFARELAALGSVFVNESFAAYHPSSSTTVLPTLLPSAAGLRFALEVEKLTKVRENPEKPLVAIMGGAKVGDKLPVIQVLAQKADMVLVGGKLVQEIQEQNLTLLENVVVGKLKDDGLDITEETIEEWKKIILAAKTIVWNGPVGKFEDPQNNATEKLAQIILQSGAEVIIGGGDSVAALTQYGLLEEAEKKAFVSVGGGAMLKFLESGTLPTIEALW